MVVLTVGATLIAAATVLLAAGVVGRRINDHPVCRRCRYDLTGAAATGPCPECGADLSKRRAIRIGMRRRRRGALATGATLGLLGLAMTTAGVWQATTGASWQSLKPAWWLEMDLTYGGDETRALAAAELRQRVQNGVLPPNRLDPFVPPLLAIQADPNAAWANDFGGLIETAWANGRLSDAMIERYVQQGVNPGVSVRTRDRVRVGHPMPIALDYNTPNPFRFSDDLLSGGGSNLWMTTSLKHIKDGDRMLADNLGGSMGSGVTSGGGRMTSNRSLDLDVGEHALTCTYDISVYEQSGGPLLTKWTRDMTLNVTVAPERTTLVTRRAAPELEAEIRAVVRSARSPQLTRPPDYDFMLGDGGFQFAGPPVALSFDVFLSDGEREVNVGAATVNAGVHTHVHLFKEPEELFPDAERLDMIFRTNPRHAERTVDIEEVWDGELAFEGLRVSPPPFEERSLEDQRRIMASHFEAEAWWSRSVIGPDRVAISVRLVQPPMAGAWRVGVRDGDNPVRDVSNIGVNANAWGAHTVMFDADELKGPIDIVFTPAPELRGELNVTDEKTFDASIVIEDVPINESR